MAGNSNLNDSARNKQDEFYTQLSLQYGMITKKLRKNIIIMLVQKKKQKPDYRGVAYDSYNN